MGALKSIGLFLVLLSACTPGDETPLPLPTDELPPFDLDYVTRTLRKTQAMPATTLSAPLVALGRRLFFDPILSKDASISCATCHRPKHGFAAPDPVAVGFGHQKGTRNTPTILNRAHGRSQFWDGRAASLEEQALKPIANPIEMGSSVEAALTRLRAADEYPKLFQKAFPDDSSADRVITEKRLAAALAAFERTLLTRPTVVDQFQDGRYAALTREQRQGLWIFESRGACWKCHSGHNYSDEAFHNIGVSFQQPTPAPGRSAVSGKKSDLRKFRTPTLRQLERTAPYMHDGSLKTLEEVVQFYNRGGSQSDPNLDPRIEPLGLSETEIQYLVAFLKALSQPAAPGLKILQQSPTPGQARK